MQQFSRLRREADIERFSRALILWQMTHFGQFAALTAVLSRKRFL